MKSGFFRFVAVTFLSQFRLKGGMYFGSQTQKFQIFIADALHYGLVSGQHTIGPISLPPGNQQVKTEGTKVSTHSSKMCFL